MSEMIHMPSQPVPDTEPVESAKVSDEQKFIEGAESETIAQFSYNEQLYKTFLASLDIVKEPSRAAALAEQTLTRLHDLGYDSHLGPLLQRAGIMRPMGGNIPISQTLATISNERGRLCQITALALMDMEQLGHPVDLVDALRQQGVVTFS